MKNRNASIKIGIIFSAIIFFNQSLISQPTTSGIISSNETWSDDIIQITGDITVNDGVTLTINPGTYVEFQGYYQLNIKGTLIAEGLPGDTIIFDINDPSGFDTYDDPGGGWAGILFADSTGTMSDNDTSRLSICKFSHTKVHNNYGRVHGATILCYQFHKLVLTGCRFTGGYAGSYGGAIYLFQATARMVDNYITGYNAQRGAAIYVYGTIKMDNNVLTKNTATSGGGAIWLQSPDTLILKNSTISYNHSDYKGGAIYGKGSYVMIDNNTFSNNTTDGEGGAIYSQGTFSHCLITNNQLDNNQSAGSGGAVYFYPYDIDTGLIEFNEVYGNESDDDGGGIYLNADEEIVVQFNDIHDNWTRNSGGGILSRGSGIIRNNEIYNNDVQYYSGGGLMLLSGTQKVTGNKIHNNTAGDGGGIYIDKDGPFIANNQIYDNTADDVDGGGIYARDASPKLTGNLVTGNTGGNGGGIYFEKSYGQIINNIIVNNEAIGGGGVCLDDNSSPVLANNTICKNKATSRDAGGALFIGLKSKPIFYNNIIYHNEAGGVENQITFSMLNPSSDFYNNNIQGGKDSIRQVAGSVLAGDYMNNIDLDPRFEDASTATGIAGDGLNADWRVEMNSPCLNKGSLEFDNFDLPPEDYFSNNRVSFSFVDIGAHEFVDTVFEICGTISADAVWAADTIKLCGDVTVAANTILTILPGVTVKSVGQHEILVNGSLLATGTENNKIIFTAGDTSGFSDPGTWPAGWDGINFIMDITSDSSKICHAIIEYCKIGDLFHGGGITVTNSPKLTISNCAIRNNKGFRGGGMYIDGSDIKINDCSFTGNSLRYNHHYGGGIYLEYSDAVIEGCLFEDNQGGNGTAIYLYQCDPVISGNIIRDNTANTSGGGIFISDRCSPVISDNIIQFNEASQNGGAIYCSGEFPVINRNHISNNSAKNGGAIYVLNENNKLTLANNIIANNSSNDYGGGIMSYGKSLEFASNTIVNNYSGKAGAGLYISQYINGQIVFYNNLFWGNRWADQDNQINLKDYFNLEIHYCNIQGGIGSITGTAPGIYINNIDENPDFLNPTSGTGKDHLTEASDWLLVSNSSLINAGTPDVTGLPVGVTDNLGNERIHAGRIDIGATENQGDVPVILLQPASQIRCEGETASFMIRVNDSSDYKWTKDGIVLPGANGAVIDIEPVATEDLGTYQCIVSNSYGTVYSNPVFLQVKEKPVILDEPDTTWVKWHVPLTIETYARGSDLKYQWMKDSIILEDQITPRLTITDPDQDDQGYYSCMISNSCDTIKTTSFPLFLVPQICMVTVDPSTGYNLIIWEKISAARFDHYTIYRESKAAGIYDLMGKVYGDELSIFADSTADPTVQAYIYKIAGKTMSGYETDIDLSKPHKTIHLLVSTNPELNTTQLEWDKYYGFEYQTYNILRSTTGSGFTPVHFLASTLSSWIDPDPLPETGYYRISVDKPVPCYPAGGGKKADAGPYSHSLSNVEDNRLQAGESPPDTVILTDNSIDENNNFGSLVGRLQTIDADTLDAHTFTLATGEGDSDNESFTILGDMLLAAEIFDYEVKDVYSIRVRCTDKGNLSREEVFTILVNDILETDVWESVVQKPRIYPNPFSESTIIRFPNPDQSDYILRITDISGKIVYIKNNIVADRITFYREDLPSGIYFIELTGSNIYQGKLIIE